MKLFVATLSLFLLGCTRGDSTGYRRFNALKFGSNLPDYIIYQPDMTPLQTQFSVCAWVRKLRSSGVPCWLSYAVSGSTNEILLSDDGYYNHIFDISWDLRSSFSIPSGNWYHYCYTWSASSKIQRAYLNGKLIGSRGTPSGRTLRTGGYLVIGNDQGGSPGRGMETRYIFGGELYKLNFFSKELSSSEVDKMAGNMCSLVEEAYGDERHIRWEDILSKTRNGDISEIVSPCNAVTLKEKLQQTEGRLNDTIRELERSKERNDALEVKLENKEQQLNDSMKELGRAKKEGQVCSADLSEKVQQQNDTQEELELMKKEKDACQTEMISREEQLNATAVQLQTTEEELDMMSKKLNSTIAVINQTQAKLELFKELLKNATDVTPDCSTNSTVTSHWDMLYSGMFFGGTITAEKLTVLRKSVEKLEYFEGLRVTDGMIRFFKLFHNGEDQCS